MKFTRITVNPKRMGGMPCIRGLHIPIAAIGGMVAEGMTEEAILKSFPDLEHYTARALQERELPMVTVG